MDLSSSKCLEPASLFSSHGGSTMEGSYGLCKGSAKNPFLDSFPDPLCKLNLKETSEFVKSFPVADGVEGRGFSEISVSRRNVEAPPTPGRPVFSFSNAKISRKGFPSKWDDAEKWVLGGSSCHDSPANNHGLFKSLDTSKMYSRQCSGYKPQLGEIYAEKSRITEEKVSKVISTFQGPLVLDHHHHTARAINGVSLSATEEVLLKDKFPNELNPIIPKFGCSEQEGFLFGSTFKKSLSEATEMAQEVQLRDIGTEMTPLGSNTNSRCPTPFKSTSPARHNTPANRSGPLAPVGADTMDITHLQECHLAKLHLGTQFDSVTSNWSSREEEEKDVSKSLRHFEMSSECRKSVSEPRTACWQEEEKTKSCLRYQREEAKIQAWVNLQRAKAEAESRKLEVKIQKMRANLEEKLMKRMADVHRKGEEWRAEAQFQHSEQVRKVGQQAQKVMNRRNKNNNSHFTGHKSCGCFPCNNHL